jgi:tRNA-specific 2-thiouridylase
VPPRRLPFLVLPLGELTKKAVRALARKAGLPVAEKPESMELCFAGESDYRHALEGDIGRSRGPILDSAGRVLGQHEGIAGFTLGQRRGLGIAAGKPLYVTAIFPRESAVTVGSREEACRSLVRAAEVNVLAPDRLVAGERLWGKVRSLGDPAPCAVLSDGGTGFQPVAHGQDARATTTVAVEFDEPQFAPAPGQRLVLYDAQGAVVAGGVIEPEDELGRL